jgi:hypothetical protein
MATKLYKCPFGDNRKYLNKQALYDHMEKEHKAMLGGLPAAQVYFNFRNHYALLRGYGKSLISGKPTKFNLTTERYEKFVDDSEKEKYRELFRQRMISKYGKDMLLDEPEQQKKMLANRSISGEFVWDDGEKTTYTGSYEKAFLQFLNINYDWASPADIMAPAPMIIDYKDSEGNQRFHIPDFYIQSLDMIVNIKAASNMGYRLRDIEDEKAQNEAIRQTDYNYVEIYDNDFTAFAKAVDYLTTVDLDDPNIKRIFIVNY